MLTGRPLPPLRVLALDASALVMDDPSLETTLTDSSERVRDERTAAGGRVEKEDGALRIGGVRITVNRA